VVFFSFGVALGRFEVAAGEFVGEAEEGLVLLEVLVLMFGEYWDIYVLVGDGCQR
jgi:hypothetical protein